MNIETISAYFLASFFTFVALFYTVRLVRSSAPKQFLGKPGSQHWLGHVSFRSFRVLILAVCLFRIPFPVIDDYLFFCTYMMTPAVIISGALMMVAGFIFTVFGHYSLGEAWTSGLNPNGPPSLVKNGLYRLSRNPMFIGVLITQWGFFLALPSVFTFICLAVGHIAIFNQVKLEEHFLKNRFGDSYLDYVNQVPRWFRFSHPTRRHDDLKSSL